MAVSSKAKRKADGSLERPPRTHRQLDPKLASPSAASDSDVKDTVPSIYDDPMIDPQDDSEDESSGASQSGHEVSSAGPSRPHASIYRAPTLAEMDALRSLESDGAGTSFSLQLDALLSSTLLAPSSSSPLKTVLSTLHDHINSLPDQPVQIPSKAVKRLKLGSIPFPGPDCFNPLKGAEVQWGFGWEKPKEVLVGGSWGVVGGYKRAKGQAGNVDLVVILPPALLSPKDRMSYRYFHKRTFYLAVILASLLEQSKNKKSQLYGCSVGWQTTGGDSRRSAIALTFGKSHGLKYDTEITIHAGLSSDVFSPTSLLPTKSLVRHPEIDHDAPSPLYSTSILQDTLYKPHLLHLHRLSTRMANEHTVRDFLCLWRIWALRRGIQRHRGGDGWFAGMLMALVVDGGESGGDSNKVKRIRGLGTSIGAWAALRAAWELLAHTDFEKSPTHIAPSTDTKLLDSSLVPFKHALVDPTGSVNILAGWDQGEVDILRHHARETLSLLEDVDLDHFAGVFLRDITQGSVAYDEFVTVDISSSKWQGDLIAQSERPSPEDRICAELADILRRGLSDRARIVHVWPLSSDLVAVGVVLEPTQASRVVDVGPSAEKPLESEQFVALWGDKAELRRFRDGSISQSVVWDISRPEDAAFIPSRIITYLTCRHVFVTSESVSTITSNSSWASIIQVPASARESVCVAKSERLGFRPVIDAYDDLYKLLKSIDAELPLAILQVQPAAEMLRYSSTFVPHPIDLHRIISAPDCLKWIPQADIILQFESSPRWPDDLAAIQKVKLAMFEKLSRVVASQRPDSKTTIVFDSGRSAIEDSAALQVILPVGVAFRIRIYHERERTLLERIIEGEEQTFGTALPQPPRRLVQPALDLHLQRFIYSPQHHSAITPLHHRYPSYSSATRLLKRWFSAHMLSLQIDNRAIELIMAHVYLVPGALPAPSSAVSGFSRAISFLAQWDGREQPLFVPLFSFVHQVGRPRFPQDKRIDASSAFELRKRKNGELGHSAWTIVTEEDLEGQRWCNKVSLVVANRVRALAKSTSQALASSAESLNVPALFSTPTSGYDVVINLRPSLVTRLAEGVSADCNEWETRLTHRNVRNSVYGDEVFVDFNPADTFARDVQRVFGDALLVFYDAYGGSTVGLLWNPAYLSPRGLKPFSGYSSQPATGSAALVELDKNSILGQISRMGQGLISSIEV